MKDGRHTRRWIALLAVGTLLWVLAGTRSVARSEQATRSSTALDLVILIDDSNSMYDTPGGPKGSDPEKYRREAAIIMLNMCETKSSRAAVISFGSRPRELVPDGMSYDNGLLSISGDNLRVRAALAKDINAHDYGHSDTDVARALRYALKLFDKTPPIEGNQRVILLLTDEMPYRFMTGDNKDAAINRGKDEMLSLVRDSSLFNPTIPDSVKIYVIELLKSTLDSTIDDPYLQITKQTEGSIYITTKADDLPATFTEMLADQIGSTLSTQRGIAAEMEDGRYTIPIRIPNRSVTEANLLLSMDGIQEGSVWLYKPLVDGQASPEQAIIDGKTVFYDTTNSFIQFKITEPCENGTWHLVFQSDAATIANNAKPAASITVLFSYDLELNASLVAADGAHTLDAVAKNDTLEINAWFVDPDGQRSKDRMLYQSAQPDANTPEAGIRAYAYALPADSAASSDVNGAKENAIRLEPTQAGEGGFSSVCRLADLGITRAGAYRLYLRAQGEGLARDLQEPIAFTVVNQPPAFAQDGDITLTINNPADEVMNPHMEKTVCLDEDGLCEDADAPVDTLSLSARSEDTGIVRVEEDANRKDDRVTLTAVRSGETNVVLTANDGDTGDAVQKTVPVRVVDVGLSLANRYEPEIIVENTPGEDGAYAINDTLRLRLHVRDKEVSGVDRDGYLLTPSLTLTEENGAVTELPLTETPGGEGWSASLDSGLQTRTIRLTARVLIGRPENNVALEMPAPLTVRIVNRPPVLQPGVIDAVRNAYWVRPFFLSFRRADKSYAFSLAPCFADDDPPVYRTYFACLLPGGAAAPATPEEAAAAAVTGGNRLALQLLPDGVATLTPGEPGTFLLVCAQTDAAGQTALFTLPVEVRSIWEWWWRDAWPYLLGLALFAAAALIVRQTTRPSFQGMSLTLLRNGNLQVTKQFPNSKKKMFMAPFKPVFSGADSGAANEAASNLILKPGRNHSLWLRLKKPARNNVHLNLNGPLRPKRWARMRVGHVLTLQYQENGTTTTYGWKLVLNQPAAGVPGMPPVRPPHPPGL